MEPEGSLPLSQVPAICPYPEPARTSPYPYIPIPEDPSYYYSPIYAWVSQVVSSLRFSHQKPVHASPLPHTCYMPRPSHSFRFYHPNNIGWGVQILSFSLCGFLERLEPKLIVVEGELREVHAQELHYLSYSRYMDIVIKFIELGF